MITPRLKMLLRHVRGASAADIGTDHAYVPIELAKNGLRVIASDISEGPLRAAELNVKKAGVLAELRLGGGLTPFKANETDSIIIAGMGGEMIEKILRESPKKAENTYLLLQPMNSQYELRKFLTENGYLILGEDLAKEGHKIYNLIIAYKGSCEDKNINDEYKREIDFHLPVCLYDNPLFYALLEKKQREFTKIYEGMSASAGGAGEAQAYKQLLDELLKIRESAGKRI